MLHVAHCITETCPQKTVVDLPLLTVPEFGTEPRQNIRIGDEGSLFFWGGGMVTSNLDSNP